MGRRLSTLCRRRRRFLWTLSALVRYFSFYFAWWKSIVSALNSAERSLTTFGSGVLFSLTMYFRFKSCLSSVWRVFLVCCFPNPYLIHSFCLNISSRARIIEILRVLPFFASSRWLLQQNEPHDDFRLSRDHQIWSTGLEILMHVWH